MTVAFAWWGFRGRWDEIGDAIATTGPGELLLAVAVALAGLLLTAVLWRHLLSRLGSSVPQRDAAAIFFVGQLGKYIPGSVWSFAAQAQLGRRHRVPARSSVAASSVFLLLHTFSGVTLGSALAAAGVLDTDLPRWLWALAAVAGVAALLPPIVRPLGSRIAGRPLVEEAGNGRHETYTARDLAVAVALMLGTWTAYGAALVVLLPSTVDPAAVVGAFALSHAAGVLLVFAPAGLGAREGVLIALLGPAVGTAPAAAAALLARVVHTVADFLAAAAAAATSRATEPARADEKHARSASC
nr:lysylphosphatidylglycerol synthase domain-containing protein [Nocardioides thalensis]